MDDRTTTPRRRRRAAQLGGAVPVLLVLAACAGGAAAAAHGVPAQSTTAPVTTTTTTTSPSPVPSRGGPVLAVAPTATPSPLVVTADPDGDRPCIVQVPGDDSTGSPQGVEGAVAVDPDPVGATLVWIPGMNATHCAAQITTLDQAAARHLAADLDAASPLATGGGAFNCGAGDRASVDVYLRCPGESRAETVRVEMNGCGFIDAPGRSPRFAREAVRTDLEAVAPLDWTDRFGG